jgi:hypothetical protein
MSPAPRPDAAFSACSSPDLGTDRTPGRGNPSSACSELVYGHQLIADSEPSLVQPSTVSELYEFLWERISEQIEPAGGQIRSHSRIFSISDDDPASGLRLRTVYNLMLSPLAADRFSMYGPEYFGLLGCVGPGAPLRGDIGQCFYSCVTWCESAIVLFPFISSSPKLFFRSIARCFELSLSSSIEVVCSFPNWGGSFSKFRKRFDDLDPVLLSVLVLGLPELAFSEYSGDIVPENFCDSICACASLRELAAGVSSLDEAGRAAFARFSNATSFFRSSLSALGHGLTFTSSVVTGLSTHRIPDVIFDRLNSTNRSERDESRRIVAAISYLSSSSDNSSDFSYIVRPLAVDDHQGLSPPPVFELSHDLIDSTDTTLSGHSDPAPADIALPGHSDPASADIALPGHSDPAPTVPDIVSSVVVSPPPSQVDCSTEEDVAGEASLPENAAVVAPPLPSVTPGAAFSSPVPESGSPFPETTVSLAVPDAGGVSTPDSPIPSASSDPLSLRDVSGLVASSPDNIPVTHPPADASSSVVDRPPAVDTPGSPESDVGPEESGAAGGAL